MAIQKLLLSRDKGPLRGQVCKSWRNERCTIRAVVHVSLLVFVIPRLAALTVALRSAQSKRPLQPAEFTRRRPRSSSVSAALGPCCGVFCTQQPSLSRVRRIIRPARQPPGRAFDTGKYRAIRSPWWSEASPSSRCGGPAVPPSRLNKLRQQLPGRFVVRAAIRGRRTDLANFLARANDGSL